MHLFLTQRTLTLPMVGFAQSHSGSRFKLLKFAKLAIIRKEKLEKLFYACSSAEGILSATLHTQSVQFVNKQFNKHVCQIQGETELENRAVACRGEALGVERQAAILKVEIQLKKN